MKGAIMLKESEPVLAGGGGMARLPETGVDDAMHVGAWDASACPIVGMIACVCELAFDEVPK